MGWYSDNYFSGNPEHKTGVDLNGGKNQVKKVYDLAGNVWEWTMESFDTYCRSNRGGSYRYTGYYGPASHRDDYNPPSNSGESIGFRPTLFLKS